MNTMGSVIATEIEKMLDKLGSELVHSPFLSVIIVNRQYRVLWSNQRFADEMNGGQSVAGRRCFEALGSDKAHKDCPLQKSLREGKRMKGFLDFGDRNFLFLTIPLDEDHAAKVHIFLPKEADNVLEEK